ncbi:hypothetical protein IEN85_03730 [Pelagicoccus sp. NFK12]|uniref:Uncharacterized protein n=1 Tax=Pelagicoccus enzymogenes TaxID=2773457 RepID=A0A927IE27_9BACT|nr:hypothetical protein [Pelagicoccus enzymogenes]MBD5778587.1 hypothetical protein [Pelagicoccus enzymogenes]
MRIDFLTSLRGLTVIAAVIFQSALFAASNNEHWYRLPSSAELPLSAGNLSPEASGYSLSGLSAFKTSESNLVETQSYGRVDPSGSLQWAFSTEDATFQLHSDPSSQDHAFAYRIGEAYLDVLRINGNNRSKTFSFRYPLAPSNIGSDLSFLANSRIGFLQNVGTSQRLAVFDANGSPVFENSYSSAGFMPTSPTEDVTQSTRIHRISGSPEIYLTVLKSIRNQSKSTFNNTFFVLRINANGQLQWSRSFAIETVSRTSDQAGVVDGKLLIALPDTTVGIPGQPFSSVPSTHLALVDSNGALNFARTLENFTYNGTSALTDENAYYIAGSTPNPNTLFATNPALLSISSTSGTIEFQTSFASDKTATLQLAGIAGANIFASIPQDSQNLLLSLNKRLQVIASKRSSNTNLRVDSQSTPYFSSYLPSKAAIGFLETDSELTVSLDSSIKLVEEQQTVVAPQVSAPTLDLNLLGLSVSTSPASNDKSSIDIDYEFVSIERYKASSQKIADPIPASLSVKSSGIATLSFDSEYGWDYQLQKSHPTTGEFSTIDSLSGTGQTTSFSLTVSHGSAALFRIVKVTAATQE